MVVGFISTSISVVYIIGQYLAILGGRGR